MIRGTSTEAYKSIKDIKGKQQDVFRVISKHTAISNLEIAYELQQPINRITGRTRELVEMGLVEEAYRAPSAITGKKVIHWRKK